VLKSLCLWCFMVTISGGVGSLVPVAMVLQVYILFQILVPESQFCYVIPFVC
jgi:hypothetical protein